MIEVTTKVLRGSHNYGGVAALERVVQEVGTLRHERDEAREQLNRMVIVEAFEDVCKERDEARAEVRRLLDGYA